MEGRIMTKICYLIRQHKENENKHHHSEENLQYEHKHHHDTEKDDDATIKNGDYLKYIAKHGHHFCKELAKFAVSKLNNSNGRLKYEKIEEIFSQSGENLTDGNTIADLYYMTNKIKSRHSTATIKSDSHVVMLAVEYLNDPSDEDVFCDWVDNMKRRNENIDWSNFL